MCFSVLDLKDGVYNTKLYEASSEHCAFSRPFGTYKFLRLPCLGEMLPQETSRNSQNKFLDILK